MGNTGRHASYRGKSIAGADFALEAPNLGEVVEGIDVADGATFWNNQGGADDAEGLLTPDLCFHAYLRMHRRRRDDRQRVQEQGTDRTANQFILGALKKSRGRAVDDMNHAVRTSGDETRANGLDDVGMQRLQVLQFAALVTQFNANLANPGAKASGKVSHRDKREPVDHD